ncbi:SusD/RagB family nutrient-binding outer membrane lipoprotein [Fulvivirgaceae bacterium BMA12]|uniref:SusD/RagB family nutrient-binding outer membrane lipoprotein n=1 Tax=Agaribacillus aureus TaxID=3051825 RepID=A0ABT8L831_9BACT|nr:SusD/RagB family nutrient-binding outer membrane lipoprotein [Fulvivirgaceae bacterium BMA12]
MKKILKYKLTIAFGIMLMISTSCNDFLDVNTDPNNPVAVSEPLLLTGVIVNFSYEVLGGYPVRVTNTWAQQTAYNAVLPHYGVYDVDENDVNNTWTFFSYTDVMQNAKILAEQATENELYDYSAIAKIIWAWNMSIITDLFGNVPFTEALDFDNFPQPRYDSQETVYTGIQALLDEAIADIDRTDGSATFVVGSDDFVYGGDMAKWRKLANVLKARFHMRLTYAPGKTASAQADLALAALAQGFTDNTDNAMYAYQNSPGAENPWFQYAIDGKWNTSTQVSASYVELLTNLDDPRLFAHARYADSAFIGHPNGAPADIDVSAIGEYYSAADAPLQWFNFAEAKFLEAEAQMIKGDRPAAQAAYQAGMQASFDELSAEIATKAANPVDTSGLSSDIAAYITAQETLDASDQVAYSQIMVQKYIANFLMFETYNDWRRTGYPALNVAQNAILAGMTEPARRFPYPSAELNYNSSNVNAEGIPIGNSAVTGRVWWNSTPDACILCN